MYIVLARKYRPKNFSELIGQEPVVRALSNALNNNRLHHAYLLTGTRGVGKTTLGRILAKCLNCEKGISSTPCGTCASCQEITAGQSLDLIEIDAASNTKVEDTRDLLENVQYAPSRDRYKIYLIDEVHMLSNHSFNALLKTLEEPPEHVKFILATTDPQKLPITILSRCLQFNLKAMPATQISAHLQNVMQQENFTAEPQALLCLAHNADGSMRDALSLLDQAISFSNGKVTIADVQTMLGTTPQQEIFALIQALQQNNAEKLFAIVDTLAGLSIDYSNALENLLFALHHIAIAQAIPNAINDDIIEKNIILTLARQLSKEDVQLYYQIALIGRRDLPLAPAPRAGFEMILLRMLSFKLNSLSSIPDNNISKNIESPMVNHVTAETKSATPAVTTTAKNEWEQLIERADLTGLTKVLASHCALKSVSDHEIILEVDGSHSAMASQIQQQKLQEALQKCLNNSIRVTIHKTELASETPAGKQQRIYEEKQQQAIENINNDPNLQDLIFQFGASIQTNTITIND